MGKQWKQILYFGGGSKITADSDLSHENKRCLLLGRNVMNNIDSTLKIRHITLLTKVCLVKAMVFPVVIHVWMWDYIGLWTKENWASNNWCLWTVVLEKTLESPLDIKETKPVSPKGNKSRIFIGRTDAEDETLVIWPHDGKNWLSGKKTSCLERLRAVGEGDDRVWDGWMASLSLWTWVWTSSRSWWWIEKPVVVWSMG